MTCPSDTLDKPLDRFGLQIAASEDPRTGKLGSQALRHGVSVQAVHIRYANDDPTPALIIGRSDEVEQNWSAGVPLNVATSKRLTSRLN
jgi:hypothetical protein